MPDNHAKINKKFLSHEIEVVNVDGVKYVSSHQLSRALVIDEVRIQKALAAAAMSCGSDTAIININAVSGGTILCNARGFVAVANQLMVGPFAKQRQSAVLEALLNGDESDKEAA